MPSTYDTRRAGRKDGSTRVTIRARWTAPPDSPPLKPPVDPRYARSFPDLPSAETWTIAMDYAARYGHPLPLREAPPPLNGGAPADVLRLPDPAPACEEPQWEDVIAVWRSTFAALAPNTRYSYETIIGKYLSPPDLPPPAQVTRRDAQAWVNGLSKLPISPARVRRIHSALSAAYNQAHLHELLDRPWPAKLKLPRLAPSDKTYLSAEQVRRLVKLMPAHRDRLVVLVAAWGGLRWGEIVALRWKDYAGGALIVRRALSDVPGRPVEFKGPKNNRVRRVPLPAFLARELSAYRPDEANPEGFVFPGRGGSHLAYSWVTITFNPRGRTIQPALRFHDLRHTCAALSIAAGANPSEIRDRLGHHSTAFTLDNYGGLFREAGEDLARRLDDLAA
jgi:integrase